MLLLIKKTSANFKSVILPETFVQTCMKPGIICYQKWSFTRGACRGGAEAAWDAYNSEGKVWRLHIRSENSSPPCLHTVYPAFLCRPPLRALWPTQKQYTVFLPGLHARLSLSTVSTSCSLLCDWLSVGSMGSCLCYSSWPAGLLKTRILSFCGMIQIW